MFQWFREWERERENVIKIQMNGQVFSFIEIAFGFHFPWNEQQPPPQSEQSKSNTQMPNSE